MMILMMKLKFRLVNLDLLLVVLKQLEGGEHEIAIKKIPKFTETLTLEKSPNFGLKFYFTN